MSATNRAPVLTRPEGSAPEDFHLSRRGLAALLTAGYAAFAASAEAAPITTDTDGLTVEDVKIGEAGGALPAYVARPAARGRFPAVIVVSEVFGVHEWVKDMCRRFAKLGYVAVAPAFFFRNDPENTLAKTTDFGLIQKIVGAAHNDQVMGDVGATLGWLQGQAFVDDRRIAITGYCWGGAVVWMAAAQFPEIKAGAAFYGRLSAPKPGQFMGDDKRDWPLDLADKLKAPVMGFYGGKDQGIRKADVDAMNEKLKASSNKNAQASSLNFYPNSQHGFMADYRSSYDQTAAMDAWMKTQAFFTAHHAAPGAKRGLFG
jgi:carboxymethylenebutenolidase